MFADKPRDKKSPQKDLTNDSTKVSFHLLFTKSIEWVRNNFNDLTFLRDSKLGCRQESCWESS
jgi:hypothetical protein